IIIVFSLMFLLIGIFFSKTFIGLFTDDSELLQLGTTYLSIVLGVSIGAFIQTFTEKTLQGTGDTLHPMIIQATGAIINIILDPIFIFGYCGLPSMGIAGAAIATVLGQIIGMFIGLFYLAKNKSISFSFLKPKFDKAVAKDILQVGIPSVVMQGIGSIMTSLMNGILIAYDIIATTVFGVYFKLQSFVFMPVFGMNSGLMPILGYNYGAKNKERMMKALKIGLGAAFTYMSLGTLVFNLFPDELLGIFNASENLLRIGRVAIRIISFSFPIASICIMLGSVFQAIGDGYVSMIVSLARQLGVLIPCAWLFGRLMGLDAIWYSYLVAEIASITISLIFFIKEQKTKLDF
ncbi:MAG: MATE family efflux transporter, partial [Sphaerochaetaceae bacterium]|nr:MATE family efflux transporter [Sphaerochaetaceae bacterium]